jgi:hypothetical protein
VLLFGHGFDRGPFGQQQFFGVQWIHGCVVNLWESLATWQLENLSQGGCR